MSSHPSSPQKNRPPKKNLPPWIYGVAVLLGMLLLMGGLFGWVRPFGSKPSTSSALEVTLPPHSDFQITRSLNVMQTHLLQLQHKQSRQKFVVATGVEHGMVEEFLSEGLTKESLQLAGESFEKLRHPNHPATFQVQGVQRLNQGTYALPDREPKVQYQTIQVRFKVGDDPTVHVYQGTLGRLPSGTEQEMVFLSYGDERHYQQNLMPLLLKQIDLN